MNLPFLPQDKANHFVYGAVIALVAYAALLITHAPHPVAFSMLAVALFAVGKETRDRLANLKAKRAGLEPPHGVELMDAVATVAGGSVVVAAALLPTRIG